jgi:hypothetical protein
MAEALPDAAAADGTEDKRALIADQLGWHTQRLVLLQRTIVTLYAAIGLLVGASLTVGLSASTAWALGWIPVAFGLGGAFLLLIAAGTLVRESRLAVRGAQTELEYVSKVVARKTTVPVPPAGPVARRRGRRQPGGARPLHIEYSALRRPNHVRDGPRRDRPAGRARVVRGRAAAGRRVHAPAGAGPPRPRPRGSARRR